MQQNSEMFQIIISNQEYTQIKARITKLEAQIKQYKIQFQKITQDKQNIQNKLEQSKLQILDFKQQTVFLQLSVLRLSKRLLSEDDNKGIMMRQNLQLIQKLQQKEEEIELKNRQIQSKMEAIDQLSKKIESNSSQISNLLKAQKQVLSIQLQNQQLKDQLQEKDILILNERQILSHRQNAIKQKEQKMDIAIKSLKDFGSSIQYEDEIKILKQKNSRLKKKISELNDQLEWITTIKIKEVNELDLNELYKQILLRVQTYWHLLYYSLNSMEQKPKKEKIYQIKTDLLYEVETRCQNMLTND